jgi:hypothetical protein
MLACMQHLVWYAQILKRLHNGCKLDELGTRPDDMKDDVYSLRIQT